MLSSERLESDQREIRVALNGKLQLSKGSHVRFILTFIGLLVLDLIRWIEDKGHPEFK